MTAVIESLDDVSDRYDALFVDLWGCVHNGVKAYANANDSLKKYRANGGKVVLVTNSPRPRSGVEKQLIKFVVYKKYLVNLRNYAILLITIFFELIYKIDKKALFVYVKFVVV